MPHPTPPHPTPPHPTPQVSPAKGLQHDHHESAQLADMFIDAAQPKDTSNSIRSSLLYNSTHHDSIFSELLTLTDIQAESCQPAATPLPGLPQAQSMLAWQGRAGLPPALLATKCPANPLDVALLEMVSSGCSGSRSVWMGLWQDAPVVIKLMIASKPELHAAAGQHGRQPLAHSPSSKLELYVAAHPLAHSHPNLVQVFASRVAKLTEGMLQPVAPTTAALQPPPPAQAAAALKLAPDSNDGFGAPHPSQCSGALQTVELASALRLMMGGRASDCIPDLYLTQVGGEGCRCTTPRCARARGRRGYARTQGRGEGCR